MSFCNIMIVKNIVKKIEFVPSNTYSDKCFFYLKDFL